LKTSLFFNPACHFNTTVNRGEEDPAHLLPPSYVFVRGESPSAVTVLGSGGLALVYILAAGWFFTPIYKHAVRTGLIARYSAESLS
jgi:ABC-2 type transport system permease protein